MKCLYCDNEINESSVFCKFCGKKVEALESVSTMGKESDEKAQVIETNDNEPLSNPKDKKENSKSPMDFEKILMTGSMFVAFPLIVFIIIAITELWSYGYGVSDAFCILDLILMIFGAIVTTVVLVVGWKNPTFVKKFKIICICVVAIAIAFSIIMIANYAQYHNSTSSSYSDYSSYSYQMDYDIYCQLYMKVSNVQVTHKGNYAYVTGTIKNTGDYSIKYVKVRAACKNYSGTVIDTDWTYAVDSSWLNPGESKKFEMMIQDSRNEIRTATVTIEY